MVNYCSVSGCGRNSKTNKHLFFYGIPKDSPRIEQWLQAIGREDLLQKNLKKLCYRVCSRHFTPSSIKNKHLCADAVPTLCLPSNEWEEKEDIKERVHEDIICNSCKKPILGFRYKCITCPDYDLCSKCEMFEAHCDHYLLRIPKPANYKAADDIIKKLQSYMNIEHVTVNSHLDASSDDDMPITEYVKQYDSGIDLSDDVKAKIRNEVTRVLNIKHTETKKIKRKKESKKKEVSKKKKLNTEVESTQLESLLPEVAFADVNDIRGGQILDIKHEIPTDIAPIIDVPAIDQPMTDLNLSDADFILTSLN